MAAEFMSLGKQSSCRLPSAFPQEEEVSQLPSVLLTQRLSREWAGGQLQTQRQKKDKADLSGAVCPWGLLKALLVMSETGPDPRGEDRPLTLRSS